MKTIGIVCLLFLISCQKRQTELETNWSEELLGFGEFWSEIDTAHQDFYYFGNLKMDSTKLRCFYFGIPQLRNDTLFFPNSLLYHHFMFSDSLEFKWKEGFMDRDTSAYLISKDSSGIIHLQKAYGIHWTPRRLCLSMSPKNHDEEVKYFQYRFWSGIGNGNMLVDSIKGVSYYLHNLSYGMRYQLKSNVFTPRDSIIFNSFLNSLINNRLKIKQLGLNHCWEGNSIHLMYQDSIYEYDTDSNIKNRDAFTNYFLYKINKNTDTSDIEFNVLDYFPDRVFRVRRRPIAREIDIPPPPPEL